MKALRPIALVRRLSCLCAFALLLGLASNALAGLTVNLLSDAPAWPGAPTISTTGGFNLQTDFNIEVTTQPQECTSTTVCNGAATHTFVPTSSFTLDKFFIRLAGAPTTGEIYLFPEPVGGTETDGFVNVSFSTSLLNGGAAMPFTFAGTPTRSLVEFDLTDTDEITLSAGTKYAIDIRNTGTDNATNTIYWMRGGPPQSTYTGGSIYETNANTQPGERFDVGGSRRDGALAIYAASTPVAGDYNGNGIVDAADYVVWRNGGPLQNEVADPGTVSAADYTEWRARFANTSGVGAGLDVRAVPEPSAWLLALAAMGLAGLRRRRQQVRCVPRIKVNDMTKRYIMVLRIVAVCFSGAFWPASSMAADFYFGTFDEMPTYTITGTGAYGDPNRTGWIDLQGQVTSANTSTTIGVTSGTQSLAWQPGSVGFYYGIGYKVQLAPITLAERNAIIEAFLANSHLAMNVTWDRNDWITHHNGDINSQNYSLVNAFAVNYGPDGEFVQLGPPSIDTGNPNFPGGWDPVNYTDDTHTRVVMWDYSAVKPAIQALYDAGTMNGQNGWLEFILATNAASGDPGYSPPVTYYLDSWRFTTPGAPGVPGDYNGNGVVDGADYVVWRNGGPLQNEVADPGSVSAADYTEWRARFGNTSGAGSGLGGAAVPEPSVWLLAVGLAALITLRRSQPSRPS